MAAPASYSRRSFVGNAAATTVPLGLGAADGSCTIASATNWPSGSGGDFLVVIDRGQNTEELAWSSGVSGTTLTFALRGAQGTSGVAHAAGCTIALSMGSQDLDEANQVVAGVLGQSGAAKGDILAMLSAAGPNTLTRVPIGTSTQVLGVAAGLPAWETPANGYGIAGFAANPMTPAVSLTEVESFIISPVTLTASSITNITSVSLTAGTWLVLGRMYVTTNSASQSIIDMWLGTSSASTTGALAAAGAITGLASSTNGQTIELSKVLVVGTTENVYLNVIAGQTSGAQAISTTESLGSVTGISAVRLA